MAEKSEADVADVEPDPTVAENEKKTNPHVFGQSEIFFQKLFEHIQPIYQGSSSGFLIILKKAQRPILTIYQGS